MAPPKKTVKMDLNSFLNDDTFGSSWAEEDVDLNKISIPIDNLKANTVPLEELAAAKNNSSGGNFRGSRLDPALGGSGRRDFSDRVEYPVPDHPPYRAIINNIPWDISPEGVQAWVEDGLHKPDAVEEVDLPRSMKDPTRLKGIAFVTLKERDGLVQTLTFNGTKLNERTVYVSVAAPRREGFRGGGDDFDWNGARGSNYQSAGDSGPDLDWGSARGSQYEERKPRREEPNLDWGAARGSQFQEKPEYKERKPRRDEPKLDWGAARGAQFQEKDNRKSKSQKPASTEPAAEATKIQRSAFDVLSNEDDEDDEEEAVQESGKQDTKVSQLSEETANLSVQDKDEWETVGKK